MNMHYFYSKPQDIDFSFVTGFLQGSEYQAGLKYIECTLHF